jgi:multisubunit Na+/H+ antiporter MnhB subunit
VTEQHIPIPNGSDGSKMTARPGSKETRSKELLVPRLLASLISLSIVGLGVTVILTQHYYGRSTKLGGAEISLDGAAAIAMGFCTVFFGLFPLAFWFPAKRPALVWVVACFSAAGVAFYISLHSGNA